MYLKAKKISSVLFVFLSIALLVLHLSRFFLRTPPIWPDESLFAAPAMDLIHRGKMGTEYLREVLPGIGDRTYWMPPVYFVMLSGVFKVFGSSIVAMRGFTLVVSLGVILLTSLLAMEIGLGLWGALFGFCVLALHELFEPTMVLGRMEALVMLFLFGSAWIVARELNRAEHAPMRGARFALAGLFAGLAAMSHPFGAVGCAALGVAILLNSPKCVSFAQRLKFVLIAAVAAILCVIPWGIYILQSPDDFKAQFGSQMARKAKMVADIGFFELVRSNLGAFSTKGWILGALFLLLGLFGIYSASLKKRGAWIVFWVQVFILLMLLRTREMWYPAYLIPLTVIGLGGLAKRDANREKFQGLPRQLTFGLCVLAWMGAGYWWVCGVLHRVDENMSVVESHRKPDAYLKWAHEISESIPQALDQGKQDQTKRVLIASIPDPTFGLLDRQDLQLRQFSPVSIEPALYERYIASADYIVISERKVDPSVANYARSHGVLAKTIEVSDDPEFKAFVYQMKQR